MSFNKKVRITLLIVSIVLVISWVLIPDENISAVLIWLGIISFIGWFFVLIVKPFTKKDSIIQANEGHDRSQDLEVLLPEQWSDNHKLYIKKYRSSYKTWSWAKWILTASIIAEWLWLLALVWLYIYSVQGIYPEFTENWWNIVNTFDVINWIGLLLWYILFIVFVILMIIYNHKIIKLMNTIWNNLKVSTWWSVIINIILIFRGIILIPIESQRAIFILNQYLKDRSTKIVDINTSKIDKDHSIVILRIIAIISYIWYKLTESMFPEGIYSYTTVAQYIEYTKIIPYDIVFWILSLAASIIIWRQVKIMQEWQREIIENGLL